MNQSLNRLGEVSQGQKQFFFILKHRMFKTEIAHVIY